MWSLVQVQNETQRERAGELIAEYLRWINESVQSEYGLAFDIEAMLDSDITDAAKFQPPFGRFYLAQNGDQVAGVGCLISDARQMGYRALRLESLKFLAAAHALYHSLGFKEISPYTDNSMRDYQAVANLDLYRTKVVFMELVL